MTTNQHSEPNGVEAPMPGMGFVFGCVEFDSAHDAVEAALRHRSRASQRARDAANAAIDNSGIVLDGFRKAALAPLARLTDAVSLEMVKHQNHRLAGAVLELWRESQPKLAQAAIRRLESDGLSALGPKREQFDALRPVAEARAEAESLVEEHADAEFSADHALLMLSYLSGRFPFDRPAISGFLAEWLDRLEGLPTEAPEWADVPAFAARAAELAAEKERSRSEALETAISGEMERIVKDFGDELDYLEASPLPDGAGVAAQLDLAPEGKRVLEELGAALAAFAEVRLPAPTMSEERHRAEQRITRADDAARLAAEWQALAAKAGQAAAEADAPDEQPPKAEPSVELQRLEVEKANLIAARDALAVEKAKLEEDNRRLQGHVEERQHAYDKLFTEKETQSDDNSQLRSELRESRQLVETWRLASLQRAEEEGIEPLSIENVADAIEAARKMFPHTLIIELNSASRPDQAYRHPQEVYDALRWLGTEYHYLRTTPLGKNPEYDLRLKEACNGWTYRGKQSDTAKGMFTKEYETTVNGKTYLLDAHIGEGTRGNPQNMIRIAFAWDPNLEKVVVGYVGPHQKTQAS